MDLAYGDERIFKLRDILQEYYMKQMEMWCGTNIDAVQFADDWGTQISLIRNRFCDVHAPSFVSERKGALSCEDCVGKVQRGQEA